MPKTEDDLEGELSDILAELERKGYLTQVGVTQDAARFPLYKVSSKGFAALDEK